jgi:hypothetical protein
VNHLLILALFLGSQKASIQIQPYSITEFPSKYSDTVEQVIVTTERLQSAFESFAQGKREKGLNCVIRTVEWIDRNYPGCDSPERIRNFLRDEHYKWATRSVLLGGDVTEVPIRRIRSTTYCRPYYDIATDMYYGCLEGSWNANGNDVWGEVLRIEHTSDTVMHSDGTTFDVHLWSGRFPATNTEQVQTCVNKVLAYEKGSLGSSKYKNKLLMVAGKLHGSSTADVAVWHCTHIKNIFPSYFEKHVLHDTISRTPPNLSKQTLMDSLREGYGYVYVVIEGSSSQDWTTHCCNINRMDADTLHSPWAFMTVISCYANWAEVSSLSKHFIRNPHGWAFGYRGSDRLGWEPNELDLNKPFFRKLFADATGDSTTETGKLCSYAKSEIVPAFYSGGQEKDNRARDSFMAYLPLADPELRLWTDIPKSLSVEFPDVVDVGETGFTVTVKDSLSQPLRDARVCVSRRNELYARGFSDENGEIGFVVCPEASGLLKLIVTKQDFLPYEGYLFVNASKPFVKYKSHFVGGKIEAGKEFLLRLSLENMTGVKASNVEAELKPDSSLVTMIDSTRDYGNIDPSKSQTRDYRITIDKDFSSRQLGFRIISRFDEGTSEDTFHLQIHAPSLSHYCHSSDAGDITPGTPIRLSFCIKNSGNDKAVGVSARLFSLNQNISVTDSTEEMDSIPGHMIETYQNCFTILPNDTAEAPRFVIEIEDEMSRTWIDTFRLKFPHPPESLFTSPGFRSVTVGWKSVEDEHGYNVYRAPDSLLLNFDLTWENPMFTDKEPDGFRIHSYWVTAVDEDLNESRFSSDISGAPNPFLREGWPRSARTTQAYLSTSAAIGNIDPSTSELEVVVNGDDGILYAWHHDGQGVLSPEGIFVDNLGSCWTEPAIADVNADGTLEIVRVQWFTSVPKLYVLQADGSSLPGFPARLEGDWGTFSTPAVQDLDGDGLLEIIAMGHSSGNVYVFKADGSGFLHDDGIFATMENAVSCIASPAVADIDFDDTLEIVTACIDMVYAWSVDGEVLPNWPVEILGRPSSPAIGDIDPDCPGLEVAIHSTGNHMYVFHADGSLFWKKSCATIAAARMSSATLGDVDDDGLLEIALIGRDKLHLWNHDGTLVRDQAGVAVENMFIPMMTGVPRASPTIGDVDGDGESEILVISQTQGDIYAIEKDGTVTPGFPIMANGATDGTPTICDIDLDGANELILATGTPDVRIWNVLGTKVEWGTFAHDRWRTGLYGFVPPDIGINEGRGVTIDHFRLSQNKPNPFVTLTTVRYDVPVSTRVSLKVYDLSGRLVRTLINREMPRGCHEVNWRGRDNEGRRVTSGIYFYRLETREFQTAKKLILL